MNLSRTWFADCGGIDTFLSDYWQRKPLLIRNAFPNFQSPISADELAGLALEEDIESRLIIGGKEPFDWSLKNGPFEEDIFQTLPPSHWTLLVQAVDQWLPEVQEILSHFDFLPSWRLDDIMVSYAEDQGGVGPHFDQYDVFLLQGEGQRRWQTGQVCDATTALLTDVDLKILQDFKAQNEWVLEPGDMLYLPPGLAHWGVAEGECITYSIGFRAPTGVEMLNDLVTELLAKEESDAVHVYRDPDLSKINSKFSGGMIDKSFIESAKQLLIAQLNDEKLLGEWFTRYMTTRKYPDLELGDANVDQAPLPVLSDETLIVRHPSSRFAALTNTDEQGEYTILGVDGELYPCSREFGTLMANQNLWRITDIMPFSDEEKSIFATLLAMGSLQAQSELDS